MMCRDGKGEYLDMDIKTIEAYAELINEASKKGVLGTYTYHTEPKNRVHLTGEVLENLLLNSLVELNVTKDGAESYPYVASFVSGEFMYFSLYTEKEIKNKFGGLINELTTED